MVDKAAEGCADKKYEGVAALLSDRLFPDMFTLARQFRQASDFGRNIPFPGQRRAPGFPCD